MKSLFSRLRHNNNREDRPSSRPSPSQSIAHITKPLPPPQRSSSYSTPNVDQLRSETPIAALHSQSSSSSSSSTRPHSIIGSFDEGHGSSGEHFDAEETIPMRGSSGDEGHVKKVTFWSPVPTPTTSLIMDNVPFARAPEEQDAVIPSTHIPSTRVVSTSPQKTTFSLPQPSSNQSRSISRQSLPNPLKPITTRKSSFQMTNSGQSSPVKSAMSPTPSEHSLGSFSTQSYLPQPNSWSEMAEDDLIANLGPKERTRQEVLYEIVSSEERYVQELVKLNNTFCSALLPPSAHSPSLRLLSSANDLSQTLSPALSAHSPISTAESFDYLPIAAQYANSDSPTMSSNPRMNAYNILTNGRPGDVSGRKGSVIDMNGPNARSHKSLPPPKRDDNPASGDNRMSYHVGAKDKSQTIRVTSASSVAFSKTGTAPPLPEPLEKVLTVLANGILQGHIKLATALRKRYDNQYPLVRSLADIFTAHSYLLREYATYVLHLEKALEHVDDALSAYTSAPNKRASRRLEDTNLGRLGKSLLMLEELAAERGESGLAISLSKPFQRLLKYPLLFQNLLFNTDPSLKEYEATLAMVDEVEEIVRSIEDQKASFEEREKTRDVWARIDGLEKDKALMVPKPNRLLVNEEQLQLGEGEVKTLRETSSKQKKSFKRLSDILKGSESADLWIVRFSDVSLLCDRTGMTNLPVSNNFKGLRSESQSELNGRSKHATISKRHGSIKARNLYRFIKVHEGEQQGPFAQNETSSRPIKPSDVKALPSLPDVVNISASKGVLVESRQEPTRVPLKDKDGPAVNSGPDRKDADTETMVSDRLSVMSFAFKGSDQVKPVVRRARPSAPPRVSGTNSGPARPFSASNPTAVYPQRRVSGGHMTGDAANAKFAHRLRSTEIEGQARSKSGARAPEQAPTGKNHHICHPVANLKNYAKR